MSMPSCLQHMDQLISIVNQESWQDLSRIEGYVAWLAWAMGWPQFLSTHVWQRSTYCYEYYGGTTFWQFHEFCAHHYGASPSMLMQLLHCWPFYQWDHQVPRHTLPSVSRPQTQCLGRDGSNTGQPCLDVPRAVQSANQHHTIYQFCSSISHTCKGGRHIVAKSAPTPKFVCKKFYRIKWKQAMAWWSGGFPLRPTLRTPSPKECSHPKQGSTRV
jgi:hypothetical protein